MILEPLDDGETSGNDVLQRLMHYLISPKYLPQVSWTGRGKGKERKFALSACVQLVNFIVLTMNKIDSSYTHKKVVSEITYGILKRAPSKFGKSKASNQKDGPASISSERQEDSADPSSLVIARTETIPSPEPSASSSCNTKPASETFTPIYSSGYFQKSVPQSEGFASMHQRVLPPMNYWDGRYPPPPYVYPPSMHRL